LLALLSGDWADTSQADPIHPSRAQATIGAAPDDAGTIRERRKPRTPNLRDRAGRLVGVPGGRRGAATSPCRHTVAPRRPPGFAPLSVGLPL